MPVIIQDESPLGKELAKWETPRRLGGMKNDGFEEFPKMLYMARALPTGAFEVFDLVGERSLDAQRVEQARTFNASNILIVRSAHEEADAVSRGWRHSSAEAMAYQLALQQDISTAAAEANFAARSMSASAQQEFAAAQAASDAHVTDVPAPKRSHHKKAEATA